MLRLKPNRDRVLQPRRGRFWCRCDMNLIGDGTKCPTCGSSNGKRRLKKAEPWE